MNQLVYQYRLNKVKKIVPGGKTGQLSIYNGLIAAQEIARDEENIVLIHDGVRPLINEELIKRNIQDVKDYIYDFGYFGVIWCTALVSFIYNQIYYTIKYSKKRSVLYDISIIFFGYIAYGYFYMSIQEQPLSAILCTTTIIMPILFMLVVYCLKLKVRFLKIRFCRR